MKLKCALKRFFADETAVTSIEYALIGVLIGGVCIAALAALSGNLNALYTGVCNKVTGAIAGAPAC